MKRKIILIIFIIVCCCGLFITGFQFYLQQKPQWTAEEIYETYRIYGIQNMKEEGSVNGADFEELKKSIPDVAGWIYSPGTSIDYPVVQGIDNQYYLNHTADRKQNSMGAIFMDAANHRDYSDDVTILYGHHIKGGRMFSSLSGYKKQSYYEEHPTLILDTEEKTYKIKLFAGNIISGQQDNFPLMFESEESRTLWVEEWIKTSTFESGIIPASGDRIMVLCTCSYEFKDARYVLYGILSEQQ